MTANRKNQLAFMKPSRGSWHDFLRMRLCVGICKAPRVSWTPRTGNNTMSVRDFEKPFCSRKQLARHKSLNGFSPPSTIDNKTSFSVYFKHFFGCFRYTRWMTRYVAVATIGAIWILAAFVSFVPISLGLHRPNEPLVFEVRNGKEYPTCALDLTPTYAVVSSCISFYVPCIVLVLIYCR